MSSSSSSRGQNPKLFKIDTNGKVYCKHELVATLGVAGKRSSRPGQEFYGCSLWPRSDCKFFIWKEEVDALKTNRCNCNMVEMNVQRLELEKKLLVKENKRLKKTEVLLEENNRLKKTEGGMPIWGLVCAFVCGVLFALYFLF